jgi:hypothetical protein
MNLKVFDLLARAVDFSVGAILDGSCMLDYGVAFFAGGFLQLLDTHLGRLPFVLSQGVSLPAIMQLTEHRAVSSVIGYFQTGGASANPAARLLDD